MSLEVSHNEQKWFTYADELIGRFYVFIRAYVEKLTIGK